MGKTRGKLIDLNVKETRRRREPKTKLDRSGYYFGDSGNQTTACLFVLHHVYKADTDHFRDLFETDTLEAFILLRRKFQHVESDGWTTARLYWLTQNNLLKVKIKNDQYDIENTLNEIVFRFIQPIQAFPIKSKCYCSACPKSIRESTSVDIPPRKVIGQYLNFIPAFVIDRAALCGESLGPVEPLDYPAQYIVDDRFPVTDAAINVVA
ncbi:unnamed protein product [Didymodactylos carnosus]|uniref:Transposase n=1 Tax=Didymodactylos carnosus TaxID=1234261 RepID=A0A814BRB7_9BILA|nr:unnamed protein product [Didymodactylos carnosus]CAF1033064.1 unnamed protein product [Didymodactylos carnosus]CAF3710620.1 unnamed protein product [Didymodactylos carnosus]CAF3801326.1 unnamed protein product [Didymodactylos carnosus]